MRPYIMRLRRWRIIHIAADIEVVVIGSIRDLALRHNSGVIGDLGIPLIGGGHFFNVFRAQIILRSPGEILVIRIDKQHPAAPILRFVGVRRIAGDVGTHNQNTCRDARTIKEILRQADDRFDQILVQNLLRISFSAPPRNSTPWGRTVATMPPGLQTASIC